jgi:hypothetical protein
MTEPDTFPVGWLLLDDVKRQLAIDGTDTADDVLIQDIIDATEPEVCRARPDSFSAGVFATRGHRARAATTPADHPDAYRGAVMLAARLVRRRLSPAGIESFGESVTYVASYDPDLDRFLRRNRQRMPGVG